MNEVYMPSWLRVVLIALNVLVWATVVVVWFRGGDPTASLFAAALFTFVSSGVSGVVRRKGPSAKADGDAS